MIPLLVLHLWLMLSTFKDTSGFCGVYVSAGTKWEQVSYESKEDFRQCQRNLNWRDNFYHALSKTWPLPESELQELHEHDPFVIFVPPPADLPIPKELQ